jgi:Short C-terminal domain
LAELERLQSLYERGALTQEEFEQEKARWKERV